MHFFQYLPANTQSPQSTTIVCVLFTVLLRLDMDEEENSERKIEKRAFTGQRAAPTYPRISTREQRNIRQSPLLPTPLCTFYVDHGAMGLWLWLLRSSQLAKGRGGPYGPYLAIFLWRLRRLHLAGTTRIRLTSLGGHRKLRASRHSHAFFVFLPWNHGTHGASVRHSSALLLLPSLAGLAAYQSSSATLLLCLLASVTCREAGDGRCSLWRPVSDHVPLPSSNTPESTRENGNLGCCCYAPGMSTAAAYAAEWRCNFSTSTLTKFTIRHSASCTAHPVISNTCSATVGYRRYLGRRTPQMPDAVDAAHSAKFTAIPESPKPKTMDAGYLPVTLNGSLGMLRSYCKVLKSLLSFAVETALEPVRPRIVSNFPFLSLRFGRLAPGCGIFPRRNDLLRALFSWPLETGGVLSFFPILYGYERELVLGPFGLPPSGKCERELPRGKQNQSAREYTIPAVVFGQIMLVIKRFGVMQVELLDRPRQAQKGCHHAGLGQRDHPNDPAERTPLYPYSQAVCTLSPRMRRMVKPNPRRPNLGGTGVTSKEQPGFGSGRGPQLVKGSRLRLVSDRRQDRGVPDMIIRSITPVLRTDLHMSFNPIIIIIIFKPQNPPRVLGQGAPPIKSIALDTGRGPYNTVIQSFSIYLVCILAFGRNFDMSLRVSRPWPSRMFLHHATRAALCSVSPTYGFNERVARDTSVIPQHGGHVFPLSDGCLGDDGPYFGVKSGERPATRSTVRPVSPFPATMIGPSTHPELCVASVGRYQPG
ncbi:uncharacterized protein CLUP02_03279 [Colletotrichum lupini]|uniref:Uncharacterized protein n=1 Tax=Colletotrichum lupini TaxID=145971 RepID=A0A9Q8SIL4_9PEZI|nr:uncharacterized protein CLUP02_03279 [Colletotrichum lupini]UQC77808.1 hypothetical protein CLUP02_03279 [Colletotrichum lupini]